ncbi:MAG: hypothetical protein IPK03_09510 [Bacteroidetes bacterium]|nr:hypothetical protein [Bacteroidota bacterium]
MKKVILFFILHLFFSKEFFGKSNRVPLNEQAIEQTLKKNQASIQFIENKGQWDNRASYHGKAMNTDLWFTKRGIRLDAFSLEQDNTLRDEQGYKVIDTNGIRKGQVWDMHFIGMNEEAQYKPKEIRKEYYNYFIGNDSTKWAGNVKLYNELWHEDIYRGIDIRYYSNDQGILEYDFIVQPNTAYQNIKFTIEEQSTCI